MSISATAGEDRDESIFERMTRESAKRASPADERDALFERLREFESAGGVPNSGQAPAEGVPNSGEAPADVPKAEEPAEPFTPTAVTYDDVPLIVIPLVHPFTIEGQAIRSVSLRPPRLDYIKAVAAGDLTRIDLVAEMAGLTALAINSMRWPDAERVLAAVADLAPNLEA